ncbi:MAG: hypothetical protein E5Y16_27535 [Mesorhizobium sp.]|nr:MAG: hypothetical protein E5Y16_27535 [Mesorhizobium sp.]
MPLKMERKLQSSKDIQKIAKFSGFGQLLIMRGKEHRRYRNRTSICGRSTASMGCRPSQTAAKQPLMTRFDHAAQNRVSAGRSAPLATSAIAQATSEQ